MKSIKNWIFALCCGLILVGCNSGSSSPSNGGGTPVNPTPGAPTVILTSPNPTTNVILSPTITLTFSEAVNGVTPSTIQLFQATNIVPTTTTITPSGNSYTLTPSEALLPEKRYLVVVNPGITSVATGLPVTLPSTPFTFTTAKATGLLTSIGTVATESVPQVVTISPNGLNVYVVNNVSNTVSQYSRNNSTGILTALVVPATVTTGTNPSGITISPDGNYVYVVNNGDGTISQYSRSAGLLTSIGTVTTVTNPLGISISKDGSFVYVIGNNNPAPSYRVSQYSRNSGTGVLTALSPAYVTTGFEPRGITISPDGNYVYITNSDRTIYEYSRSANGLLTSIGNVVTENIPNGITISPDGKDVYVADTDSNVVSQYSRSKDGRLTAIGTVATGTKPVGITISLDGVNVYVTNSNSNTVSQYSRK